MVRRTEYAAKYIKKKRVESSRRGVAMEDIEKGGNQTKHWFLHDYASLSGGGGGHILRRFLCITRVLYIYSSFADSE